MIWDFLQLSITNCWPLISLESRGGRPPVLSREGFVIQVFRHVFLFRFVLVGRVLFAPLVPGELLFGLENAPRHYLAVDLFLELLRTAGVGLVRLLLLASETCAHRR